MGLSQFTPKKTAWLGARGTAGLIQMTSPWVLAHGVAASQLRLLHEIRQRTGNYQHKVAFQTAPVSTDFPDAWSVVGSFRSTNDVFVDDFPAIAWAGKLWVRAGIAVSLTAAPVGEAQVSLQVMWPGSARVVGARTLNLNPDLNANQTAYHQITDPFPALLLAEVMVACIVSGLSGTLSYQPAIRFFNRDDGAPGTWSDLGSVSNPSMNDMHNFVGQTVTPGANLWAQVGLKVTAVGRATVQTITSAKY